MKKLLVILAAVVALVGVMAIPLVASAEKVDPERVDLQGKGVLAAKGSGRAQIEGRLNFRGQARAAVLVVEDKAGDARVQVTGYGKKIDEGNGKVRYEGFNGYAHIEGSRVAITLAGREMRFIVRGAGKATLQGRGWYRVNGSAPQPWTPTGATMEFDDTAAGN